MKIEKGKTYYIEAKANGVIFFPNGKYYTYGQDIKGNLDGSTLLMVENSINIIDIKEVKVNRDNKPKVEVKNEQESIAKDIENEFESMLKED